MAGLLVVLAASLSAGVVYLITNDSATSDRSTGDAQETIFVYYSMSVGGEWCSDLETTGDSNWGFDDIPGMEFQIRDENDKVIGNGRLPDSGIDTEASCDFYAAEIEVPLSEVYQIGNPDRGYVTWDQNDVINGRLDASAEL